MENIKTLYYQRFIQHVISSFEPILKGAKPGHCMKITGLAIKELLQLLPLLRSLNPDLSVYILSETLKGEEYIHATKLIEFRNDPEKSVLILVPSNDRTSAEDSYGDATFQNLSAASLQDSFLWELIADIPRDKEYLWQEMWSLFREIDVEPIRLVNYLLYIELHNYEDEAWGNGLYLLGFLPDRDLVKNGSKIRRRFMLNVEKISSVLSDFSMTTADRIAALPLVKNTVQRDLMKFLTTEEQIDNADTLFACIHDLHSEFNYASLPWVEKDTDKTVKIYVEILPGKDKKKELVRDESGEYVLSIPLDKKGKVSFSIISDPSPKDNPDIVSFEVALVSIENFEEVGVVKKIKVKTNKNGKRRSSVTLANGTFEDGEYIIRVRALDENDIVLDHEKLFKEEHVQLAWEEAHAQNPNLPIEQFRQEHNVAYINESAVFTIDNSGEEVEDDGVVDKRTKVNSLMQAVIHYRASHLSKNEDLENEDIDGERNNWQEGTLNNTYQFDFGTAYAYQIQLSRKLIQLENAFLKHSDHFGCVEAFLTGNPTDIYLLDPLDHAVREPRFVKCRQLDIPEGLAELRENLFDAISESAENHSGLVCTFNVKDHLSQIKDYLTEYETWLRDYSDVDMDKDALVELQNLDVVNLEVEMPDGSVVEMKLLSPLHPLRLSWMVNYYELYNEWEDRTLAHAPYRKAWPKYLNKLFQKQLQLNIAPLVLNEVNIEEPYQYIGELMFGWGAYVQPLKDSTGSLSSSYRQLKSYAAELLNVVREKRIDNDVSLDLVCKHLSNYICSHPYSNKLTINLFNAGDAVVFAQALIVLEKLGVGKNLSYELRLFTNDDMLQSGEAFKELIDPESNIAPEAEVFTQASANRLFPKLRFSINRVDEFLEKPSNFQSNITFLVNPFTTQTSLIRPDELSRSFYLNGTVCKNIVDASREGKAFVWNRYFSNKSLATPVTESANLTVSIFSRLQEITGRTMASTATVSVPSTTLRLKEKDMTLLSFVHENSDWVVTFDKNMGPEFYDLPCLGDGEIPYLLDYLPGNEATGMSSYLTTRPTSEISALLVPLFMQYGINIETKKNFKSILEDVRAVSSSILMQVNSTSRKGFEVIGTTLTKRFLQKKGISTESFLIPIDLHKELFENLDNENKERADNLVVKLNPKKKEILFSVVEIKCRNANYDVAELHSKITEQIENTIFALRYHFEIAVDGKDRLDRELKTQELRNLLTFYIQRSLRYCQLTPETMHQYMQFLSRLDEGYTIRFKRLGIVYDFKQNERQKKSFYGDCVIYTMGKPVVDDILSETATLKTEFLESKDKDFINFFEPTFINSNDTATSGDTSEEPFKDGEEICTETSESAESVHFPDVSAENQDNLVVDTPERYESQKKVEVTPVDIQNEVAPQKNSQTEQKDKVIVSKVSTKVIYKSTNEDTTDHACETPEEVVEKPNIDVIIGKNEDSPQYGVLGKMVANGRVVGIDLNECNTISLFGVQGAGKSYTIGSITEMVLRQVSHVNLLPSPMASVIFHYSDSMDYAPEFTSMVYPNDAAGQLAKLKAEYGADANSIEDVVLLAPASQVKLRKEEYPDIQVFPIGFDSSELSVKDWMFLLGAVGNDSAYIKELKQIMKSCRYKMSLENIRQGVANDGHMSNSQRSLAEQKLDFASEYITDGNKLQQYLKPERLIIVDLRDEFIEKDEALGLFVVMLNIFSSVRVVNGNSFNKFIVFDEAHKYMNNKDLVESITTSIREMRHKGVSVMIASQDPMSLPTEIIELSSIVVLHKFSSPAWVKHVQKAITPLQSLTPTEMASLGSGEAYLWANKSSDKMITQKPIKISIRPRFSKHGGDTIKAVK